MAPWSVVSDDKQAAGKRRHPFSYLLFSLAAVLVLSLGITLIPAEPPAPETPTAAEIARSAALADAVHLRSAAERLPAQPGGGTAAMGDVVTLLTVHARALLLPGEAALQPGSTTEPEAAAPTAEATPSVPELASDLAASGLKRLRDAAGTGDGGLARLLAGVGTAQLLAAERLQPGAGQVTPATGEGAASSPAAVRCPSPATAAADQSRASSPPSTAAPTPASAAAALSAVLVAEREAVYAYEAAMPRLAPGAAGPASAFLGLHRDLVRDAETRMAAGCQTAPIQQPGYAIDAEFLQAPAGRLGSLEASALGAYGDLIALSEDETRNWAVSALHAAAARAVHWGADPGPVPGVAVDPAQLPEPGEQREAAEQPEAAAAAAPEPSAPAPQRPQH